MKKIAQKLNNKVTLRQLDNILCIAGSIVLICLALDIMKVLNGEKFSVLEIILAVITYSASVMCVFLRMYIFFDNKQRKRIKEEQIKIIEEPTINIGKYPADIDLKEIEIEADAEEYMEDENDKEDN
jgi:Na+/melibiose symporter-like transporter